jgi:hypothetical protein
MTSIELAAEMAKEAGFEIAVFEKEWNGYEVFYGDFKEDKNLCLGLPYYMLVKNGEIRLSTADEECELCGLVTLPSGTVQDFEEILKNWED